MTIPISIVTGNTAGCTLEYTVEAFSIPDNTWVTLTDALKTSTYTFISSANFDTKTTNAFSV